MKTLTLLLTLITPFTASADYDPANEHAVDAYVRVETSELDAITQLAAECMKAAAAFEKLGVKFAGLNRVRSGKLDNGSYIAVGQCVMNMKDLKKQ